MATTRSGFALKKFTDADTERTYSAGEEIKDIDAGLYGNYERAGLVGDKRPTKADEAAKPAA